MLDVVEGAVAPVALVAGFDDGDFEHGDGELAGFPAAGSLRQGFFYFLFLFFFFFSFFLGS